MQPVQLWLPLLGFNPVKPDEARELTRAEAAWRGEDRLWLLPDWKEVRSWAIDFAYQSVRVRIREAGIPSEALNVFGTHDVDREGRLWPPVGDCIPEEWRGRLPPDLWRLWLNALPDLHLEDQGPPFSIRIPQFEGEEVIYRPGALTLEPGPVLPISAAAHRKVTVRWPPDAASRSPVSPEQEALERHGPPRWNPETATWRHPSRPAEQVLCLRLLWPRPFDHTFGPTGGRSDVLFEHAFMKDCVRLIAEGKREEALNAARARLNLYAREGMTTVERSWLFPEMLRAQEQRADPEKEALWAIQERYRDRFRDLSSLAALWSHPDYATQFRAPQVPVIRVIGWVGLFWLQFVAYVEPGYTVRLCERCGWVITGRADKRYCGREDNPDCFRARQREDQQKSRQRRKQVKPLVTGTFRHEGN